MQPSVYPTDNTQKDILLKTGSLDQDIIFQGINKFESENKTFDFLCYNLVTLLCSYTWCLCNNNNQLTFI